MEDKIYGTNPVLEALSSGREIDKILILDGARHSRISRITAMAKEKGIAYRFVSKQSLDRLCEGENHQGVVAYAAAHSYADVEDILNIARKKGEPPFVIIAENLSDPHNLGSIIRTANAAGAHGVIIPKNRSVGLNSTVARVSNIASTVEKLKKEGLWIVGTAVEGNMTHYDCDLTGALGIVIGSEGEGMSRIVREKCDFLVKIPMIGEIESLNASVAAGVLVYEALRQRLKKK